MNPLSVMQVVDSLRLGGLESVAVNYANHLAARRWRSFLCSTRESGPLAERISPSVTHLNLRRRGLIDIAALKRFTAFVRKEEIDLLQAHGTSLFFSTLAGLLVPRVRVLWHDHYGGSITKERPWWIYRFAARRTAGVISVNTALAEWSRTRLRVNADRVWYVPNFATEPMREIQGTDLPGRAGTRIVCLANLRPQKDHISLVDAMRIVVASEPSASLILVGDESNKEHVTRIRERIRQHRLQERIFTLGSRSDVSSLLKACDIGVLSSASEGLPLALLEYGAAGLPTVATSVGQIPDVLDNGLAGILVPPGDTASLASALLKLLRSPELRRNLGNQLRNHVNRNYSESVVMNQVLSIYGQIMSVDAIQARRCSAT